MASSGNEVAPPGADPCNEFVRNAFVCLQVMGPMECGCFGDTSTFIDDFPRVTRESFFSTMAFAAPQDPSFCDLANDRVCEYYDTNQSCCCQAETDMARKCLVENVLSNELPVPLPAPCQSDCSPKVEEKSGGGGGIVIVAILIVLLLLGGGGGYYYWRRRKLQQQSGTEGKESTKDGEDDEDASSAEQEEDFTIKEIDIEQGGEVMSKPKSKERESPKTNKSSDSSSYSSNSSSEDESEDIERGTTQRKPTPKLVPSKSYRDEERSGDERLENSNKESTSSKKAAELKKKRHAIETWNKEKKEGSTKSLLSYISNEDELNDNKLNDDEDDELKPRRSSRRDRKKSRRSRHDDLQRAQSDGALDVSDRDVDDDVMYSKGRKSNITTSSKPNDEAMKELMAKLEATSAGLNARMEKYQSELDRVAKEKESSKQRVKELARERHEMSQRLAQLEHAQTDQAEKLLAAELDRRAAEKRLEELEAKNKKLSHKLKKSQSASNVYAEEPTTPSYELAEEEEAPRKHSSSKRRDSSRDLMRVASDSRLDADDDEGKKKKRSSSSKKRRSSSRNVMEPSKVEEMTTSWAKYGN